MDEVEVIEAGSSKPNKNLNDSKSVAGEKTRFFSALREDVVRALSLARSRTKSPTRSASPMSGLLRRKKQQMGSGSHFNTNNPEPLIARSGSLRPVGETLTPLMEGPAPDGNNSEHGDSKREGWGHWMKGQLSRAPSVSATAYKRSDLRLLLGVMGR